MPSGPKTKETATANLLFNLAGVLGLLQGDANEFLQGRNHYVLTAETGEYKLAGSDAILTKSFSSEKINELRDLRAEAKKSKNFAEADRIRKELADAGIILEDTPQGTTWRRA